MPAEDQQAASLRLDEIYRYTRDSWGAEQAERYITEVFAAFDQIESHGVASRPIPAEFGVEGFYFRHAHHFLYWRRLSNGDIGKHLQVVHHLLVDLFGPCDLFRISHSLGADRGHHAIVNSFSLSPNKPDQPECQTGGQGHVESTSSTAWLQR